MNELELLSRYRRVEPMDSALIDATLQAILHSPDTTGRRRQRPSGPRRRRVARLILAGASVAAAVAAAAGLVAGTGGSSSPDPAPQVTPAGGGVLTASVVRHSLAALETSSGYVERVVQRDSSGTPHLVERADPAPQRGSRPDRNPVDLGRRRGHRVEHRLPGTTPGPGRPSPAPAPPPGPIGAPPPPARTCSP